VFGLFRPKLKRLGNITVYCLSGFDEQGNARASPLGIVSRLTDEQERAIQERHRPRGEAYLQDALNGVSVIVYWTGQGVDAVSFLSVEDARAACPDLAEFQPEDLNQLDRVLTHFPR
jgi:hypothetical protein